MAEKYDFDKVIDRRGTWSYKWDIKENKFPIENELPMWVADMDFETAPEIKEVLKKRADHGVFGYGIVPDEWYDAITGWWEKRHDFHIEKDWLMFCTGVVPAISSIVRKITTPGENVLVQTPVYNIFFNSIKNNGRNVVENPLSYNGSTYEIDWRDLEKKLSDPQTTLMILCNPQNPSGKLWDHDTLFRIGELCDMHHVTVLSDEIHCDLTDPGCEYYPFASVSSLCRKISITCIAPTKAFNIAGLQTAAIFVPDPVLRHKVWRGINTDEVAEPNAFAIDAAIAAFTKGADWLDALRGYIYENKNTVRRFLEEELNCIRLVTGTATYLLWLDCSQVAEDSERLAAYIRKETGLYLSAGSHYGGNGSMFLRMNIACPRSSLMDGLNRLKKGIERYQNR